MNLVLRKASLNEIATAFLLLKEAAIWLKEKGIDYWQDWHNPPANFQEWIIEGFQNNEFQFVEYDNEIVGMFRLQFNDELFWGKRDDNSGYIHSFTTKRNLKGKGIGKEILRCIETYITNLGINYLRLDCSSEVQDLCKYYEQNGFKAVGTKTLFGDKMNLYEKVLRGIP